MCAWMNKAIQLFLRIYLRNCHFARIKCLVLSYFTSRDRRMCLRSKKSKERILSFLWDKTKKTCANIWHKHQQERSVAEYPDRVMKLHM